jgi:putative ABC transport system substrate-binding protein
MTAPLRALALLAALLWAAAARAQTRLPRVITLWTTTQLAAAPYVAEVEAGLTEKGWKLGQTLLIEHRFTDAKPDRLRAAAAEIVAAKPDVIMAGLNIAAVELRKLTPEIPIVVSISLDPVAAGLAQSLARPGGNVTGVASPHPRSWASVFSCSRSYCRTSSGSA